MTNDLAALEAQYAKLGEEIERLKQAKEAAEWPRLGGTYFYISARGRVESCQWAYDNFDLSSKSIGNIFRTHEDAEKELEARIVTAELRQQPGRKAFVLGHKNWGVIVDFSNNTASNGWHSAHALAFASIYFESYEAVESAIQVVGADRIIAASRWLSMGV